MSWSISKKEVFAIADKKGFPRQGDEMEAGHNMGGLGKSPSQLAGYCGVWGWRGLGSCAEKVGRGHIVRGLRSLNGRRISLVDDREPLKCFN